MVSIRSYYGDSSSAQNNAKVVMVKNNRFFFSYETLVAVEPEQGGLIIRQNDWSNTTGKHLNAIDGGSKEAKAKRLPAEQFLEAIKQFEYNF